MGHEINTTSYLVIFAIINVKCIMLADQKVQLGLGGYVFLLHVS